MSGDEVCLRLGELEGSCVVSSLEDALGQFVHGGRHQECLLPTSVGERPLVLCAQCRDTNPSWLPRLSSIVGLVVGRLKKASLAPKDVRVVEHRRISI